MTKGCIDAGKDADEMSTAFSVSKMISNFYIVSTEIM